MVTKKGHILDGWSWLVLDQNADKGLIVLYLIKEQNLCLEHKENKTWRLSTKRSSEEQWPTKTLYSEGGDY